MPDSETDSLHDMRTAKMVIISRGKREGRDTLVLLFEDNSEAPYVIYLLIEQSDRRIPESDQAGGFVVSLWTREGLKATLPGKYRVIDNLPNLAQWVEQ